ncbi:LacI family DNA-binding transcriptional regulator [Geodermatophilus saharensis]|uniref:LacI family DNA-binding transcriptional regulator n=1 Tax=Geodermatophilus saharensis TaxID=1137994 RepID=UPI001C3C3790|nr:LacI family DNA-binding transcriptional regulator [Geodermatophilus saharensis]
MQPSDDPRTRRAPAAVTLRDVADRAGVSLATASRVLNGSDRVVRPDLAARVGQAAAELRYVSNGPAQALARARTNVVGLVVHEVDDPYFASIAAGAMRVATEHGLLTMLASTFRDPGREVEYVQRFQAQRVRAVLLAGSGRLAGAAELDRALGEFGDGGGRVALVSERGLPFDTVLPANARGAAQVARLLHDLGHRDVGVVTGPADLRTVADRLGGFLDAWASLGRDRDAVAVAEGDFSRAGGHAATLTLFERHPHLTAVFALNDLMAVGALSALQSDLGRRVPEDVSVVGFDDLWLAADLQPALTTVRLPLEQMGARAMELVLTEAGDAPRRVPVGAELILRASTGPARAA